MQPSNRLCQCGLVLVFLTAGCLDSDRDQWTKQREPVYPATVTILYNGKPVERATVSLRPIDGGVAAHAMTDEGGIAELTTYESGDGAIAGTHHVTVTKMTRKYKEVDVGESLPGYAPSGDQTSRKLVSRKNLLPAKYANFNTSGLTIDIATDRENKFTLELTN